MNIYIWFDVNDLTDRYHNSGGLVIIASSLESARESFLKEHPEQDKCEMFIIEPDETFALNGNVTNRVYRFQDAGCCC